MADKTLKVSIEAKDGASATFKTVGNAAESMGQAMEKAGSSGGKSLLQTLEHLQGPLTTLGGAMIGVGGIVSAAFVAPMALGTKAAWNQVDAVQKATVALRGYEQDASKVNDVLAKLVAYARSPEGVLFQRQDLFAAAQGLKVAGDATDNLVQHVEIMSRAVAQGMVGWQDLTEVIQRVGATGKLTGDDFDNLTKAGFQLDESLRNQSVSWEQLFTALDAGIPGMGDALNTIEGQSIRLQSAIRELGLAFLGVNRDTSEFISGGLGDQLYNGLGTAREVMLSMVPAAHALGEGAAIAAQGAGMVANAYLALPGPIQTVITLLGASGAVALTTGGAFLLMLPRILETVEALKVLKGLNLVSSLTSMAGAIFSPVGLLAGLAAVAIYFDRTHQAQWGTDNPIASSAKVVQDAISDLNTRGSSDLSALATRSGDAFSKISADLERIGELSKKINESDDSTDPGLLAAWNNEIAILLDKYAEFGDLAPKLGENVSAILHDMGAGAKDVQADFAGLLDQLDRGAISPAEFAEKVQGLVDSLGEYDARAKNSMQTTAALAESFTGLKAVFADLPQAIDDLRLDGKGGLANQLETLHTSIVDAFTKPLNEVQATMLENAIPPEFWESAMPPATLTDLTEQQLDQLGGAWDRTMQGMSSDTLDNAAVIQAWSDILNSSLSPDDKIAALTDLSVHMGQFRDGAKAMHEQQLDFLKDGNNILDWWREYDRQLTEGARVSGQSSEAIIAAREAFRDAVDWAGDIGDAGRALDQVLRTFQEIDSLGQRSSAAGSIAENLVGKPGEWAAIDDMLTRWLQQSQSVDETTAAYERYNQTVAAGYAIQDSNARVQALLNDLRADQLPLLAEEQQAYEDNLQYLSGLNAEEQRRALLLQDSSVQTQIASAYATAYSASIGEIPKEVATEMLVNTAQADPALAGILVQMGLLNEAIGPNGEKTFTVNFPNADATVSAINRLTIAFLSMEAAAEGVSTLDLAIKIYGEEEALDLLGYVKNADGTYSKVTVEADSSGLDTAVSDLKEVTLADGTVVTVKTDVDTSGWDQLTASELAAKFDNDPVQIPVEGVIQPMDGVTPEEWNAMIGPFPEIEIPAKVGEIDTSSIWDSINPFGGGGTDSAAVTIPVDADTTSAVTAIGDVTGMTIDDKTAVILGDNGAAVSAIDTVNTSTIDDKTLTVGADASAAYGAIDAVNNTPVYDKTMTINVVTAYSTIGTPSIGSRHGGIPGYARGGIVTELAEAGPELLHFASGGSVPIFDRGIYTVPPMTYVSPANTGTARGDRGIHIDFSGATFNGTSRAEMDRWAETSLVPNLRKVLQDERAGYPR